MSAFDPLQTSVEPIGSTHAHQAIRPGPDADGVNSVPRSAFAQYEGAYKDWDTLIRGVSM
jgi:hypothetical protein